MFDHGDVFGDAVNVASRIQSVGVPSSIIFFRIVFTKKLYTMNSLKRSNLEPLTSKMFLIRWNFIP
ncbi:hypothetical protein [Algoriphagus boritolerans]|uniref:hypothetical protein n=1 Tax=Algoriphagus boritolerans TaxID=308111 RepID=UPI003A0FC3C2